MASAAFRSTSRRSSIGGGGDPEDTSSSSRLSRSRSLSCYSGRFPPPSPQLDEYETPRGRFVNKVRGSGFLETSLEDLADEFFRAMQGVTPSIGRSSCRTTGDRLLAETESSRRRGMSVSRHRWETSATEKKEATRNSGNSRIRRSVSVSRSRRGKSEAGRTDMSRSLSKNSLTSACESFQKPSLHKQNTGESPLVRSMSQKEFFQAHDCYSSHSSSLTDDEAQDPRLSASVIERENYGLGKKDYPLGYDRGLKFEDKNKEVRNLVEELTELEKSKQRKQDLLANLAMEERRDQELCKIVRELLSSPKEVIELEKSSQSRQGSSDKLRISKCLNEEAERYFEDFLSNVEDTDLSSFDDERSDTGSTTKLRKPMNNDEAEFMKAVFPPTETDGVIFPWLLWETSPSSSPPSPTKSTTAIKQDSETLPQNSSSVNQRSSLGSWNPEGNEDTCAISGISSNIRLGVVESQKSEFTVEDGGSSFDMDEYLELQRSENLQLEIWEQRHRIASGSLVLCGRTLF